MTVSTPKSEQQLLKRAQAIAGMTLAQLAAKLELPVPRQLLHAKGWAGQLVEKILGAHAQNLDEPDFIELGIELKTLPITPLGHVTESTFLCTATLPFRESDWFESRVWRKIAKILWVPIETQAHLALGERRIGLPLLWQPSPHMLRLLQQDWEEISELLMTGQYQQLDAYKGQYLQLRPKAANSQTLITVLNHENDRIQTVPKGFYLRKSFTQKIIHHYYNHPK